MQLTLSDQEATVLRDILDWWIEGMEDATTAVEKDPALSSPEEMLRMLQGMHEQFDTITTLRMKLVPSKKEECV